jgi:hypothetical protein
MARKSSLNRLDPEVKAYIEAMLATGAQTLDELIADLQERYPAAAKEGTLPSRSAVHRYGQKLDRRLSAIRASTEAAKLIQAQAGDDQDARSEALTALVQTAAESVDKLARTGGLSAETAEQIRREILGIAA